MEETTIDKRNYELAYHLMADLEESAVATRMHEVESLITGHGGSIISSREPKKIHLSYPLLHKHYAHFGIVDFQGEPDIVNELNAQMKLQEDVLRFMIVSLPEDSTKTKTLGDIRNRSSRPQVAATHQKPSVEAPKPKEAGEEKEMEKKLEDVLEKI